MDIGKLVLFSVVFLFSPLVFSESPLDDEESRELFYKGGNSVILAMADGYMVNVIDQVDGGCMSSPQMVDQEMDASLRRNGFRVLEPSDFGAQLVVSALGYGLEAGLCVVYIDVFVSDLLNSQVPKIGSERTLVSHQIDIYGTLIVGSRGNMQAKIQQAVSDAGNRLFVKTSRARDEWFDKIPALRSIYLDGGI